MASTRNRNMKNEYCLYSRQNENISNNRTFKYRTYAYTNALPCAGINVGQMPNSVLARNAVDIESNLFGVNSTNLVTPEKTLIPEINTLQNIAFFERPEVFLPDPLVIEKNQRPDIV